MNEQHPGPDDTGRDRLEDYLDGRLSADQRAAFERLMRDDPALSAEVELQRRVDRTLGRVLSEEMARVSASPDVIRDRLKQASSAAAKPRRGVLRSPVFRWAAIGGIAALIALAAALLLMPSEPGPYDELQFVAVNRYFQEQVADGFKPDWVCDNQRFTETIQETLRRTLTLEPMPADRRMLGLSYVPRARLYSVVMLGRYNEQPVLVFFDLTNLADEFYDLEVGDGLHVHQRELGDLRAIEVSPYDEPVFLQYLASPDPDDE